MATIGESPVAPGSLWPMPYAKGLGGNPVSVPGGLIPYASRPILPGGAEWAVWMWRCGGR